MSSIPNLDSPQAEPNTEQIETMDLETAQRVERDRVTRRAALRKLGFGAGLAAFSLLGVDDFARMVGKRMERMAGDNKVAQRIATEFNQAGIALAAGPSACGKKSTQDDCTQCCQDQCNGAWGCTNNCERVAGCLNKG